MGGVRPRSTSLILCLWAVGGACVGQPLPADQAAEVYARVTNQFGAAIFFKPAQATNADLACQLAPLIIQEVGEGQAPADPLRDQPGTSTISRDVPASSFVIRHSSLAGAAGISNGVGALGPSQPVVYWAGDTVQINGKSHARFSYQWWYSPIQPSGQTALRRQGIRITLDSRAQPAAWEVLADTSGLRLIFISQSLEKAAAAAFGKPLPGRRYSIERDVARTPNVIVPRVIDDGPVAMGPIVYLSAETRDVSTVICRCMPAQVKQFIVTRTFDLTPVDAGATSGPSAPVSWPGDDRVEDRLDKCLRLPEGF